MMLFDLAVIGIVIALILLIIFFSAVVLYLSFRIKETFRKETRRGATIVKIGFLIGTLFLAGSMFYFFARTLSNTTEPTSPPSEPAPPSPPSPAPKPTLSLSIAYPPSVKMNAIITISFTITNPTNYTAHGATIQADVLFTKFETRSSTHEVVGNIVNIGDVPSGTTIVSLELLAPNRAGTVSDTVSLLFQEMTTQVTQEITISVRGGGF